jgi:hypothetical protein
MSGADSNLSVIMALSTIRQFIWEHYGACGGLSALIAVNGLEARILEAAEGLADG